MSFPNKHIETQNHHGPKGSLGLPSVSPHSQSIRDLLAIPAPQICHPWS